MRCLRCLRRFLIDRARVTLPAYGIYTGGLASHDTAFASLKRRGALALLTGPVAQLMPMLR